VRLRELEFSTYSASLPSGEDELEIPLEWIATEDIAD